MKTVGVTYAGRTVELPDQPEYQKFYRKLAAGTWEPRTFEVLARNLDRDTVYADIGSWIGVTPFWASPYAKQVIAVEPDPSCVAILRSLAPGYPNITLLEGALSAESKVKLHAAGSFGSSETTILALGDGPEASAPGLTMRAILGHAGPGPVFVKVDVEGYEYHLRDELAGLRNFQLKGVQIAVHPQLYEMSLAGGFLTRRLATVWRTWKLSRLFGGLLPGPTLAKYPSVLKYLLSGILFRKVPRGADFLFERTIPESAR